jgi:hypothetical protein
MVADDQPVKRKRGRPLGRANIDILTATKIRNCYLYQDLTHRQIAERTGLTERVIASYVVRHRLTAEKKTRYAKTLASHDARARDSVDTICEAIASNAEEIALNGLTRARESVETPERFKDPAKDFQAWTGGIRNLVQASRQVRGLDQKGSESSSVNVSLYVTRGECVQRSEPMNVTPVSAKLSTT